MQIVKDPNSDLALLAKNGSRVVRDVRERNDRSKMRDKFWELAGSKIGKLMQVEETK